MCGIVGVINPTKKCMQGMAHLVPDMIAVGTIRGPHSSGIMKVIDGKLSWLKNSVPGWLFIQDKEFDKFVMGMGNSSFVVGHNRWATRGKIVTDNAHPFEYQHICLVHNGTVSQVSELYDKNLEVDSHMIAKCIAEQGIEATKDFLWGAFSLVWYDSKKETLNFLRNKERPMWFVHTKQGAIIFCSEAQMGVWCADRRGFVVEKTEELPVDTLWTYKQGVAEPEVTPMERVWKALPQKQARQSAEIFSIEERNLLKILARTYKNNDVFKFSLNDFDDTGTRGRFIQIFGESPENKLVTCVGNYSGPIEALYSTKTLLSGIITSIAISKKLRKVVLGLKNITITGEPDPFFDSEIVVEHGQVRHLTPKNSQPVLSSKSCALCSHVFTRQNCDDPYLITDNGQKKIVCVSCFMDRPENNPEVMDQEVYHRDTWH